MHFRHNINNNFLKIKVSESSTISLWWIDVYRGFQSDVSSSQLTNCKGEVECNFLPFLRGQEGLESGVRKHRFQFVFYNLMDLGDVWSLGTPGGAFGNRR